MKRRVKEFFTSSKDSIHKSGGVNPSTPLNSTIQYPSLAHEVKYGERVNPISAEENSHSPFLHPKVLSSINTTATSQSFYNNSSRKSIVKTFSSEVNLYIENNATFTDTPSSVPSKTTAIIINKISTELAMKEMILSKLLEALKDSITGKESSKFVFDPEDIVSEILVNLADSDILECKTIAHKMCRLLNQIIAGEDPEKELDMFAGNFSCIETKETKPYVPNADSTITSNDEVSSSGDVEGKEPMHDCV